MMNANRKEVKTIGLIGGLGPEATVDYYQEIIKQVSALNSNGSLDYPEILIYSVNMARFIGLLEEGDLTGAAEYISSCVAKLTAGGADFGAISANTPHLFFNEIQKNATIPLVSIVETCREQAKKMGLKRCGLLGTKFTMNAPFFSEVFARDHIGVVSPGKNEINRINDLLFNELEVGVFKESTKNELLGIVQKMVETEQIDSVILGCTEFPIMFTEDEYLGLPFLNTTRIHVEAILKRSLEN